ncbi:related to conserved oligomeric Golgi complex component 2 [Sporisorium reilianum SRZ2]|uniref:Conserved oligomeric Golgi complex subunit 2 n=1 Tax=Sporisorium reilianum (strain SRZ2) TaxID=999809 RepID=E6ZM72_SPORE|nr:related to conserved oligomeric Golgi complex component 2 [Sporisorium reilianum SRZ2]
MDPTSSLNGQAELYPDPDNSQESPAFPSLTPLSHDLALLSPAQTAHFSVDDFLLSRTKASDLNFILSDLRSYSEKLKHELYSIINEDYKDFVSLGSSLKAEAHRIARLGWNARSSEDAVRDHVPPQGLMAPVRDTLLASRSMLKSVEHDIQDCIRRKEDATAQKAKLELMLQLHDSIVTLEDLLLIHHDKGKKDRRRSSLAAARRPSVLSIASTRERRASLASVASGSDQELSDYAMSSEYDEDSDSDEDASADELATLPQRRTRRRILRRLSSGTHKRDSTIPTSPTKSRADALPTTSASSSSSLLGLPQRIARTSAEYSRLRFLHRRIDEECLTAYADALQDRIDTVRSVLRQDLRTLLASLLSPDSLLVHGQSSAREPASPELRKSVRAPAAAAAQARRPSFLKSHAAPIREEEGSELDAWSQVAEPAELGGGVEAAYWAARLDEQRAWLDMALGTLNTLTLVRRAEGDEGVKRRNEAEEAVRDLLVADWAAKTIVVDTEQRTNGASASRQLPQAARSLFDEHRQHVDSLLLTSPAPTPLLGLYNTLLTFVASTAWHVCDAARDIAHSTTTDPAPCDIFTNVVWDTLSSALLTTMGATIFFVGHTDTFYTNYTLTNAFLTRVLALAPSETSRRAVQEHANWHAFRRRWQLPVYFQMRFREVVTQMEAGLVEGGEGAMRAVVAAVERVWAEGVHVHELSAREWRVTLQLLSRYRTWVEQRSSDLTLPHLTAEPRPSTDRPASTEMSRVSTPQPPPDSNAQQRDDEQLQAGVALLADCFALRTHMERVLDDVILARIGAQLVGAELAELRADLRGVLDEALEFVRALAARVARLVHAVLSPRAAAPLRLLRSFSTPAYRPASSSTAGGAAVHVIAQLFAPLESFLALPEAQRLPQAVKRGWIQSVLTDTFARYTATVETITKNHQSLIRLKKSQAPSSSILSGLFKSSPPTPAAGGEPATHPDGAVAAQNRHALASFETHLAGLHLGIELETWPAWLALKRFLQSDLDQL